MQPLVTPQEAARIVARYGTTDWKERERLVEEARLSGGYQCDLIYRLARTIAEQVPSEEPCDH